jgi:hypothetical protein
MQQETSLLHGIHLPPIHDQLEIKEREYFLSRPNQLPLTREHLKVMKREASPLCFNQQAAITEQAGDIEAEELENLKSLFTHQAPCEQVNNKEPSTLHVMRRAFSINQGEGSEFNELEPSPSGSSHQPSVQGLAEVEEPQKTTFRFRYFDPGVEYHKKPRSKSHAVDKIL